MNNTLSAISQGAHWTGRLCCKNAISPKCQNGCAISTSKTDLINTGMCRISDEFNLISCIDDLESNQKCCSASKTSECLQVGFEKLLMSGWILIHSFCFQTCQKILGKKSLFPELKGELHKSCEAQNQDVLKCVQKSVDEVGKPNLSQCKFSIF